MAEAAATAEAAPPPPSALELLGQAVASIPGVTGFRIEGGELVVRTRPSTRCRRVMTTLRDDPRFAFEQMMDLCGVDWPEREERFDVVYNLLSVTLNQRVRVIVTTDVVTAGAVGPHDLAGGDVVGA